MPKHLATFDDIIKRLGGTRAVADLCKRKTTQAVWNWRKRGFFPTGLYFVMVDELAERGYTAPRWLWRFEQVDIRRDDAA